MSTAFRGPTGQVTIVDATVAADGSFTTSLTPDRSGLWEASTSSAETTTRFSTRSQPCATVILPPTNGPTTTSTPATTTAPTTSTPATTPAPTTTTTTAPRQASTLTLNCPTSWQRGAALPVQGTLTPGLAGESIALTYTPQQGGSSSSSATTGSGGAYHTSGYTPSASGTLTVSATWGGNDAYAGSSASCDVAVT